MNSLMIPSNYQYLLLYLIEIIWLDNDAKDNEDLANTAYYCVEVQLQHMIYTIIS